MDFLRQMDKIKSSIGSNGFTAAYSFADPALQSVPVGHLTPSNSDEVSPTLRSLLSND
jgi:hypothetical protein